MSLTTIKRSSWIITFIILISAITASVITVFIKYERPVRWNEADVAHRLDNDAWEIFLAASPVRLQQSRSGDDGRRSLRRVFLGNEIARMMADQNFHQAKFATLPQSIQVGLTEAISHWGDSTGDNAPAVLPKDSRVELMRTGKGQLALFVMAGTQRFSIQTDEY